MTPWFWYAAAAAVLYGAHQIFTRLAADRIGDGLGGFVVEATAALTILGYLLALRLKDIPRRYAPAGILRFIGQWAYRPPPIR